MTKLPDPFNFRDISWRQIQPTFLVLTFSLTIAAGGLLFFHTREAMRHNLELTIQEQKSHIGLAKTLLTEELRRLSIDLITFSHTPVILNFFANLQDPNAHNLINAGLSNYLQSREYYDHASVWNNDGRELIRVERRGPQITAIPPEDLETITRDAPLYQDQRLLFRDGIAIPPLELERDQKGEIIQPFHSVFKLAVSIFDQQNRKRGVLQFTCQGQQLFDLFVQATRQTHITDTLLSKNSQILNQEGYWLLAADKDDEWGFERDPQRSFSRRFPAEWKAMLAQKSGRIKTKDGLFTFATLPLVTTREDKEKNNRSHLLTNLDTDVEQNGASFWILLTQISPEELAQLNKNNLRFHLIFFLLLIGIILPFAFWISLLRHKGKENKKQLLEQEQLFRLLYDQAPLPYQSLDPQGHFLTINQAWLTATGYSRDEVIGHWFGDFVTPDSLAHFQEEFSVLISKNVTKNFEVELRKKNGSTLPASFYAQWAPSVKDDMTQTHCIFIDITELRSEKERTRHLTILLHAIIDIHRLIAETKEKQMLIQGCCDILVNNRGFASAWIILLNHEGQVECKAESGLLQNIGQPQQETELQNLPCVLACRKLQKIVVINEPQRFCANCSMASSYPRAGIMCIAIEQNSRVYGYLNVSLPLNFSLDQDGQVLFQEIAEDIAYALFNLDQQEGKRKTEQSLIQSEERLRNITNTARDAILMIDPQGAISYWNPAAETILGYSAEEALGKDLLVLLTPARFQAARQAAFPDFFRSGQDNAISKTLELTVQRKDGREIPVSLSLSAFKQDGNWHAVGILRDISEEKLIEERMLQSEKLTTIAGLAAGVAHEINTPLSAILQSIQVIRQSLSPELPKNLEVAKGCDLDLMSLQCYFQKRDINFFMDGIHDSAVKSGRIIKNLLQFSRSRNLEMTWEDLTVLLDTAVELAKSDYKLKKHYDIINIEFVREYCPQLPSVPCVAMEIEQVFINLLQNAAHALSGITDRQHRIILRAGRHEQFLRITIEDNGCGMDEETRNHIFDPFFTTKAVGEGTGLGLSVSYTIIVTKHRGQLLVKSTPGQGTTVCVDLPLEHLSPQSSPEGVS